MFVRKSFGILITGFMFNSVCVIARDMPSRDERALSNHKERAIELIAQAQAAYDQATYDSERLSQKVIAQPVGISMLSMHRPPVRLYDSAVFLCKINKCQKIKIAAEAAIEACRRWHDGLKDWPAGEQCHHAIEALAKLQR